MSTWSSRRRYRLHGSVYVIALQRFVAAEALDVGPRTAERYQRVLDHLLRYLHSINVAPVLGEGPAAILVKERQFGRESAFFRVFGFDELIVCIPGFLEPPWLMSVGADARSQVSLMARLMNRLRRDGLIDMSIVACAYWDAESAVEQARRSLRPVKSGRAQLRLVQGGRE